MNRVFISLLTGTNKAKLSLLNKGLTLKELDSLCGNDNQLKTLGLKKGYHFNRFDEIKSILDNGKYKWMTLNDNEYPGLLKEVYDPPFLLFYRGNIGVLSGNLVSIVGTRKPTLKGLHNSFKLGVDFGKCSIGVVSGLALGVDAAAHYGNVLGGGNSVAVLGSGIDAIYPKKHLSLAGDILDNGGLIISEFPPGEIPKPYNFPKRNRIIAGLVDKIIIVQAPRGSGSLITGNMALENGAEVYVDSSGIGDSKFLGTESYYKDGARVIETALPIIKSFGLDLEITDFDTNHFTTGQIVRMEFDSKIVKYKGRYFYL